MKLSILIRGMVVLFALAVGGCDKENTASESQIRFSFKFDKEQARLNNFGQPSAIPAGHAAQSPRFNSISAHYIELSPSALTPLGAGEIVYFNSETTAGGAKAIDFGKSIIVSEGQEFISLPLSSIAPGTYEYIRVSLAYQNYDIDVLATGINTSGRIASFVGYNTYISTFKIKDTELSINGNKKQGFWAFESAAGVFQGQAPEGATTVPNPIASTSPVPVGSCVVTGKFSEPLVITAGQSADIRVVLSLSINNSFEWIEVTSDNKFEPLAGEAVMDMGLRGLIPIVE
ncbi:MAG TPA: hypothetical protein VGD65_18185 [Chryseosolibacter sp.]